MMNKMKQLSKGLPVAASVFCFSTQYKSNKRSKNTERFSKE